MQDLTAANGSEPSRRTDPVEQQSAKRIAEWGGRLHADDAFIDEFEDWRQRYHKLIVGPELAGMMIAHAANMCHAGGRKHNTEELTWTFEAAYHEKMDRTLYNNLLNYCGHSEVERAIREWLGRLPKPQLPRWVERAQRDWGYKVPIIRSDIRLCPQLNGHRLRETGNADIDRALGSLYQDWNKRYPKASATERNRFEQAQAKISLVSVEAHHEVSERLSTQQRMLSMESKVDDLLRRIEGGKGRSKE